MPYHNSTAALFENGLCIEYHHEERFTNQKNYYGFPSKTLNYLSKKYDFTNIEAVTIPSTILTWFDPPSENADIRSIDPFTSISQSFLRPILDSIEYYTSLYLNQKDIFFFIYRKIILENFTSPKAKQNLINILSKKYKVDPQKIHFYDHHTCHAQSVANFYNLYKSDKKTLIFSLDGAGDNYCAKIFILNPKNKRLKLISKTRFDSSIGLLYSQVTKYLGMKPSEHEYKVMGLAAYNSDCKYYLPIYKKLKKIIWLNTKTLSFESKFNTNISEIFLKKHFIGQRFDNIASALQLLTQELILSWIKHAVSKTKISQIACTGGVFMNVKANQTIATISTVKKIYFMPSSGDESLCHGAATSYYLSKKIKTFSDQSMFKGISYSTSQIENYLKKNKYFTKYKITKSKNIELTTAKLLANFKIVARFTGKAEWGARSLCNRAILANSSDLSSFYKVNDTIKMRDFWMPFAPTILEDWADKYIKNWSKIKNKIKDSSRFMITAFDTTPLGQTHLRAAIHQKDKTIRPQLVFKNENLNLNKLLNYYQKLTGMGGLLNTSFNLHGYPLATTLDQALFTFQNSDLKYLALENFLIEKK